MINVGIHLRDIPRAGAPALKERFTSQSLCPENASITRIYVGDEFCANRLPSPDRILRFRRWAEEAGVGITLLTPILSDAAIQACTPLLDALFRKDPAAEVVVNDWGVLRFLMDRYRGFRIAAGRLLDKGFKDPRSPGNPVGGEGDELFSGGTFDHTPIREVMDRLGVCRLERDLLPGRCETGASDDRFGLSIYYPYGYFTTGRICWPASVRQRFVPGGTCDHVCQTLSMGLAHPDFTLPVFQNGNTLYYRYSSDMLSRFWRIAKSRPLRLVFQGWAMGDDGPVVDVRAV